MIPVNEPLFGIREKELLTQCIDTGWVSSEGPFVKQFEESMSSYIGVEYGIAVCNGTAALETALYAAGIEKGDEVIMPTFTIISCAIAVLRLGAIPVLVDIGPDTWNMDVTQIEAKITKRTRAIMPVHIYGHPVDMDPVLEIAKNVKKFSERKDEELTLYFDDVIDHIDKVIETLEESRETMEIYKDTDFVLSTEKTNKVLGLLTIIFTLAIPSTVIGTFYGMNINLPGGVEESLMILGPHTMFIFIILASSIPAIMMFVYFKKLGWISN